MAAKADDDNYSPGVSFRERAVATASPIAEQIIKSVTVYVADLAPFKGFIRMLSPEMIEIIHKTLPMAGGFLSTFIPDGMFRTAEMAMLTREMVREVVKSVANTMKEKKDATNDDLRAVAQEAIERVQNATVYVDASGNFHLLTCINAIRARGARRGNNQQGLGRDEMSFKDAVDQNIRVSPCCNAHAQVKWNEIAAADAQANAGSKKPGDDGRQPSPFDVIGRATPELRKRFFETMRRFSEEERKRINDALRFLDSDEEFIAFMDAEPSDWPHQAGMLESRHTAFAFKQFLGILGHGIKHGATEFVACVKASYGAFTRWDATFAEPAAAVKAARRIPVAQRVTGNKRRRAAARKARHASYPWYIRWLL